MQKTANIIWENMAKESVPNEWRVASIVPIYKNGERTACRDISVLSVASKVYRRILRTDCKRKYNTNY